MLFTFFRSIIVLSIAVCLIACGNFLKPHRISIQQGNIITPGQVAKLEEGMTKGQVKYILGTPLVVDSLSPDNWLYLYSYEHGATGQRLENHVKLRFENDTLTEIDSSIAARASSDKTGAIDPATQIAEKEREKLDKRVETEREDSIRDAGL